MKILITIILLLSGSLNAWATWSIIIIDRDTKEIGIAGASCTRSCYGIGEIIPGRGAIIVQAMSNSEARQKGSEMIHSGYSPGAIIRVLKEDHYDPEAQQYAIITMDHLGTPATYTGESTREYKGSLTGDGFSVQGNTLTDQDVLLEISADLWKKTGWP